MKRIDISIDGKSIGEADVARTFFTRFMGLMGKSPIERPLLITPCADIHTFFMREPIDVLFLDSEGNIVRVTENMQKNRLSGFVTGAKDVLELPANTLARFGLSNAKRVTFSDTGASGNI